MEAAAFKNNKNEKSTYVYCSRFLSWVKKIIKFFLSPYEKKAFALIGCLFQGQRLNEAGARKCRISYKID